MNSKFLCFILPVLIAGCQGAVKSASPSAPRATPVQAGTAAHASSENLLEGMLKTRDELEEQLRAVDKLAISVAAERIAQADEWSYTPDTEEHARQRLDAEVGKLRGRIDKEVRTLAAGAVEAALQPDIKPGSKPKNGKSAAEKMAEINSLLLLYPTPSNVEQHKKLEDLSATVLSASRRVEDIRRLRYNSWAIGRIQGGLEDYRKNLRIRGFPDLKNMFGPDREALIASCVEWMAPIDPSFLEPAVRDLYDYVFGLTLKKMGDADDDKWRIKLARGLADPQLQRKTPADF